MERLPVIDVGALAGADTKTLVGLVHDIGRACRETGFFYVTNHGIEAVGPAFAASRRFFERPAAEKEAVSIRHSAHNRGYVGMKVEALNPGTAPDLKEAFNIGVDLAPDDPDVVAGTPFRGPNLWPDDGPFRDAMLALFAAFRRLGCDLHRAIAVDLGLSPDAFEDKLDRPMATLRLLHYPPRPPEAAQGALGAGEHTDYGNLTLLATDAVGGLEVRTRRGDWLAAPALPGALVCNIGDCLMRWTNDVYVSTPHRVVSPAGQERYSIAFFLDANPDALVACLPTCVGDGARYPPVTAADYLRGRLDATYAHRKAGRP